MPDDSDQKARLAEDEEEGEIGDPVPNGVQATTALCGILAGIMIIMGLTSTEWVYAIDDHYYQGLFVYCAMGGLNDTDSSGSGSGSDSGSSSEEVGEPDYEEGCHRIPLDNQRYTLFVALLCSVAVANVIFGTMMAFLGSWVQDIDSKRKVYRMSLYLYIISIVTNFLSLVTYGANFGDVMDDCESLGPFEKDDWDEVVDDWDDWSYGWSFIICVLALIAQLGCAGTVAYGLLHFPIEEPVEEEKGGD